MIFDYIFMRYAFAAVILIAVMTPFIGNVIVLKRLSAVGDALSHMGLAGIAIGVFAGINPVFMAVIASILAAVLMEFFRAAFKRYSEISTAIVMSAGLGLAAVFSGLAQDSAGFNSYLFGSVLLVTLPEIAVLFALAIVVILINIIFYKQLMYITFDEESAKLSGIKTRLLNISFNILTAIIVSVSIKTVGVLLISSLIILPAACAMQVSRSYRSNLIISVVFALLISIGGLATAFYADLRPSGTIALIGLAILLVLIILRKKFKS